MNREQLSDAIGRLDDKLISSAMVPRRRKPWWYSAVAVAACIALVLGTVAAWPHLRPDGERPAVDTPDVSVTDDTTVITKETTTATKSTTATESTTATKHTQKVTRSTVPPAKSAGLLAAPVYPKMVKRPKSDGDGYSYDNYTQWQDSVKKQQAKLDGQSGGMTDFYSRTFRTFLEGNDGENRLYSPLNVYLALSMLAETTEGNSRRQILKLLGVSGISALRDKSSALWNGVYMDDGAVTCRLANSLWLRNDEQYRYNTDTVNRLAKDYFASVYAGKMGSKAYDRELQKWLNDQTNGLLEQQTSQQGFEKETALALASTVYFSARWYSEFSETKTDTFYTADGEKQCNYLCKKTAQDATFGDRFTCVSLKLDDGDYQMMFFRPNEGTTTSELLTDRQMLQVMQGDETGTETKQMRVDMSIPKFDVSSDRDLTSGLKSLGVTDVFNESKSDFGGIIDKQDEPVVLADANHAVRVAIDEEGVTAAAYTVIRVVSTGVPQDVLDFKLDKPFVFAITGPGNTILFAGVVENP